MATKPDGDDKGETPLGSQVSSNRGKYPKLQYLLRYTIVDCLGGLGTVAMSKSQFKFDYAAIKTNSTRITHKQ